MDFSGPQRRRGSIGGCIIKCLNDPWLPLKYQSTFFPRFWTLPPRTCPVGAQQTFHLRLISFPEPHLSSPALGSMGWESFPHSLSGPSGVPIQLFEPVKPLFLFACSWFGPPRKRADFLDREPCLKDWQIRTSYERLIIALSHSRQTSIQGSLSLPLPPIRRQEDLESHPLAP